MVQAISASTVALRIAVQKLQPGDAVRVELRHRAYPVVGVARISSNSTLATSPMLFLDVAAGHILRDSQGRPGFDVRSLEVIDSAEVLNQDEKLDLLADMMRDYADLLAARRTVPADSVAGMMIDLDVAVQKTAILNLVGGVL